MGARSKKQISKPSPASGQAFRQEAERLIAKGRLKDAVKQAKLCFRQEGTPENHRLLERAYFLRAQQLHRDAMPTSAVEVAQHLIDFGITDPALIEDAARLFLALGLGSQARALESRVGSPEARARLAVAAADQAVLHPDRAATLPEEHRGGALQVRAALAALQADDEPKAMEELRAIARSSPFADWKLFARGLAAFHRRDLEEARVNWDRLDPDRAASRIARRLLGTGTEEQAPAAELAALERQVFGEPILAPLRQLRDFIAQGRWTEAVRLLGPLRHALRRVDPGLAARLTRVLIGPMAREACHSGYREAQALVGNFTRLSEPLPIDPRWNRLWARIWEGPQGEIEGAEDYWRSYLDDLKAAADLRPDERTLAQALVWKHLGGQHLRAAGEPPEPGGASPPAPDDPEALEARRRAVECLEESLELAPRHLETHELLLRAYHYWGQPEEAEAAARRLLEVSPDHLEALRFLADYHFQRDDAGPALEFARRARALKPLDPALALGEWAALLMQARHHALARRWGEGRSAFEAADRLRPEARDDYHLLARKAAFEFKAGQAERAEQLIAEAKAHLVEPTPLWLALQIEAARYKLPKALKGRFADLWKADLAKRCRSETAGALAGLIELYLGSDTRYTGRAGHVKDVVAYLRRTSRIKYRREDLENVCRFLALLPGEGSLLGKMVGHGLKNFPDSPVFLMFSGLRELQRGPFRCNFDLARRQFEKALELAQASGDPRYAELVPRIKKSLAMLTTVAESPFGKPFGRIPGPLIDLFEEMDDGEDDFEDDDMYGAGPSRRARRKR